MKRSTYVLMGVVVFITALAAGSAYAEQGSSSQAVASDRIIDINTADVDTLAELPGIGEKVAERIVAYRKDNGRFQKIEEIMNVRGIGEKIFEKIRKNLSVGAEAEGSSSSKKKS